MIIDVERLKTIFQWNLWIDYEAWIVHIITSTIVILFVIAVSHLFENRISACMKYALWFVVAVKLLMPIPNFESEYHILNLIDNPVIEKNFFSWREDENVIFRNKMNLETTEEIVEEITKENTLEDQVFSEESQKNGLNGEFSEKIVSENKDIVDLKNEQDKINGFRRLSKVLTYIYVTGVAIISVVFLIGNIRFQKYIKKNGKYIKTYKKKIPMYKIEEYYGACLYGGFRPLILVGNNRELSMEQQYMILTHEYVHYLHGDHIWSVVRCLCVILYWYHPCVWLAVYFSERDSELACDEGTLKCIGKKQRFAYGQSLLEIAKKSADMKSKVVSPFFISKTAIGGKEEMKKRISRIAKESKTNVMALLAVLILSACCMGCTLGRPLKNSDTENEEGLKTEEVLQENQEKEEAETEKTLAKEENITDTMVEKYNLYTEPQEGKVCIRVQPSEIREQLDYYYIPSEEIQEELKEMLNHMEELLEGNKVDVITQIQSGEIDTYWNWSIIYNKKYYKVYGEGYFASLEMGTENIGPEVFYESNLRLYERISNLLIQDLDYGIVDLSTIKDLTSATLQVKAKRTDYKLYTQTIADKESLKKLEQWFSNAREIVGLYDCESDSAALLLETANGDKIRMSLAADGCTIFSINGVFYDFKPNEKLVEEWHSNHVYELFDRIPNELQSEKNVIISEGVVRKDMQEGLNENTKFVWPTTCTVITTGFGTRIHPVTGEEKRIDYIGIAGSEGDSVFAVADGTITDVGFDSILGNYIILTTKTGEVVTYGHLSGSKVPKEAEVKAGEIVGLMGKTGSATGVFLSISVEADNEKVDPMKYFN